jgi:hypothetical protein
MPANIKSIELRNLQIEDYKQLKNSMIESYPEMEESFWREDQIILLLAKFPEGTASNRCRWNCRWLSTTISYGRFCF